VGNPINGCGFAEELDRERLGWRANMARLGCQPGADEVEMLGNGTASTTITRPMVNTDDAEATSGPSIQASDSSSEISVLIEVDNQRGPEARRELVAESRKLWESTLPEASVGLSSHVEPGYNYQYINHEDTPKKELFGKRRKKFDLLEFPNPFRN